MLMERLFEKRSNNPVGSWSPKSVPDWVFDMFGSKNTASGEKVSETTALVHPDIFTCVNVLSDDVAKLPIHMFQKKNGAVHQINDHAVSKLLYIKPNKYMTAFTWKKLMMVHVGIWGNGYSYISANEDGNIEGFIPLNPANTSPYIDPNTGLLWYETLINNTRHELTSDEVLHFKGLSEDGIIGKSPITVLREHVGAQAAATKYNSRLYKNDATPRGILKVPQLLEEDAKTAARKEWKRVNRGENIAIIDAGLEYQSISMPLQDAQFVESMKYNKAQIAALYKVPMHKVNELDRATFSNIEHQGIEYVKNTLQPYLVNFEQELMSKVFTDTEFDVLKYYLKFNVNSELRGDSRSRAEYYEIMHRISGLSIDEIRELEEKNAIPNGDRHVISLNYTFLDMLEEYQLAKAGALKGGGVNGQESGNTPANNED
ncbi:phage portal protein [Shouchella clausii]|uniref:phage portal protein n=1 Tax=Shouchella clausii TaxID=79880 RepID=UPI0026F45534|nr:phage portal protein [Shouchella clausii]MDO7281731.1 phage portal protein [Shouchella clausii]MDO7301826.1 phage portal protein [Shouchella clausii]